MFNIVKAGVRHARVPMAVALGFYGREAGAVWLRRLVSTAINVTMQPGIGRFLVRHSVHAALAFSYPWAGQALATAVVLGAPGPDELLNRSATVLRETTNFCRGRQVSREQLAVAASDHSNKPDEVNSPVAGTWRSEEIGPLAERMTEGTVVLEGDDNPADINSRVSEDDTTEASMVLVSQAAPIIEEGDQFSYVNVSLPPVIESKKESKALTLPEDSDGSQGSVTPRGPEGEPGSVGQDDWEESVTVLRY